MSGKETFKTPSPDGDKKKGGAGHGGGPTTSSPNSGEKPNSLWNKCAGYLSASFNSNDSKLDGTHNSGALESSETDPQLATDSSSMSVGTPTGPGTTVFSSTDGETSHGHSSTTNHGSHEEGGDKSMENATPEQEKPRRKLFGSEEYARRIARAKAITEENLDDVVFATPQQGGHREGRTPAKPGDKRGRASSAGSSSGTTANPRKKMTGDNLITNYYNNSHAANDSVQNVSTDDSVVVVQDEGRGTPGSAQDAGNRGQAAEKGGNPDAQPTNLNPCKPKQGSLTKNQRKKRNKELKEKTKPLPCVDANLGKEERKRLRGIIQETLWPESDPSLFQSFQEKTGIILKSNALNNVVQRPEFTHLWEHFRTRKNVNEFRQSVETLMHNLLNWVPPEEADALASPANSERSEGGAGPSNNGERTGPPETRSVNPSSEGKAALATDEEPKPGPSGIQRGG